MDHVLVIGGTGFIGSRLVFALVKAGCSVRVMTRRSDLPPDSGAITYVRGDVGDRQSLRRGMDGVAVVYDLALVGRGLADVERDILTGAENVAETCIELGVRRLVYTSTTAALYLGAATTVDETAGTDPKPHLRISEYARGKIFAERALLKLHETRKLPVVIVRPAIVMGEGGALAHPGIGNWMSPTCCVTIGDGRHPLPFVLVDDVAQAMLLARDAPGIDGRTFNLVGDVRPSAAEFVALAARRSFRNFRHVGKSLAAVEAEMALFALGKALLRPDERAWPRFHEVRTATKRTQLDCSAAKRLLGWRPVDDLEEFVRRAIDPHITPPPAGDLRL